METKLSPDAQDVVKQFHKLVSNVTSKHQLRAGTFDIGVDAVFRDMHAAITDGSWEQAGQIGQEEKDEITLLVSLVEVAGSVRPSLAYPLLEMWTAQRLLARLEHPPFVDPGQLVIADVTAPLTDGLDAVSRWVWPHGPKADLVVFLEPTRNGEFLVKGLRGDSANWLEKTQADVTRPVYSLSGHNSSAAFSVGSLSAEAALEVTAEFILLEAAEMLGCAQGLLDATIAHVSTREQFGHPLSSFQALSHRLADAYTRVETLRSQVYYAGWVADYRADELLEFALMAKGTAGQYCWEVANEAIQMHGAMGFTWEMGLQHQVTRVIARTLSYPSSDECLARVGRSMIERGHMVRLVE